FSAASDLRLKENIRQFSPGLDFIKQLRPVQYTWRHMDDGQVFTGLIAQDVEKLVEEMGFEFSAVVAPEKEEDYYSLRYAEFVMPLINAVKELAETHEKLSARIESLEKMNRE
ncbi:MAG: tail fiber domain-containing protein, partial [Saprospiraceae bacterium]|nr:tail fiber domain-containing protein [Saprospiraceae bacterium]